MPILEVKNIEKHFGSTRVLEDISFSLEKGQALAIIGSSGSGKTTLLRCLNFLETPNQGIISVNGSVLLMPAILQLSGKTRYGKNASTLVWCSSPSISSPSIPPWKM